MTLNCLSELVYKTIFRNTNELSMIASDSLHFFYYPTSFYKTVQEYTQNSTGKYKNWA